MSKYLHRKTQELYLELQKKLNIPEAEIYLEKVKYEHSNRGFDSAIEFEFTVQMFKPQTLNGSAPISTTPLMHRNLTGYAKADHTHQVPHTNLRLGSVHRYNYKASLRAENQTDRLIVNLMIDSYTVPRPNGEWSISLNESLFSYAESSVQVRQDHRDQETLKMDLGPIDLVDEVFSSLFRDSHINYILDLEK